MDLVKVSPPHNTLNLSKKYGFVCTLDAVEVEADFCRKDN